MKYRKGSVRIEAEEIRIGKDVRFGKDIDIKVRGVFELGDFSRLGDKAKIRGNNIRIGKHFYNSSGLVVGGGGNAGDNANLTIGDRCTLHNNFLNVCEPITIGNDVGLSVDVSIITHGYWMSVLDGFPRKYEGVVICDGAIIGYRSTLLMGSVIPENAVIGAESVVAKELQHPKSVYAGNPVMLIRPIHDRRKDEKIKLLTDIAKKLGAQSKYPTIVYDGFVADVITGEYWGHETEQTDRFRDELRKYGIRIYTERPF